MFGTKLRTEDFLAFSRARGSLADTSSAEPLKFSSIRRDKTHPSFIQKPGTNQTAGNPDALMRGEGDIREWFECESDFRDSFSPFLTLTLNS